MAGSPFSKYSSEFCQKCDEALDQWDVEALKTLKDEAEHRVDKENIASQAQIYYCIGNIFSAMPKELCASTEEATEQVLLYYRKSISAIEKEHNQSLSFIQTLECQLYTNYANALIRCGRFIAAIEQYKKVLAINNTFGMALGNLGKLYQYYAFLEYDPGHSHYFHYFAYHYLTMSIQADDANMTCQAKKAFAEAIDCYSQEYIEKILKKDLKIKPYHYKNKKELAYRKWCLSNRLFLNTLNDLPISELCFAADVLQLPDMLANQYKTPVFHGMFAQLKEEYIYARYLYYESLTIRTKPSFADRDTFIESYTDYASYSIRLEKLKTAFKTLYGMFDKIAFFLAHYFDMGFQSPRHIDYKSIWKTRIGSSKDGYELKNQLDRSNNSALDALYWIYKDFFDLHKSDDSPNPNLKRIADIRNFLEHRYVKIYDDRLCDCNSDKDELAEYVSEDELSHMTLSLLKILREAIINLCFCVTSSEKGKNNNAKDSMTIPLYLMHFDDKFKL